MEPRPTLKHRHSVGQIQWRKSSEASPGLGRVGPTPDPTGVLSTQTPSLVNVSANHVAWKEASGPVGLVQGPLSQQSLSELVWPLTNPTALPQPAWF